MALTGITVDDQTPLPDTRPYVGWVDESSGRGTLGLIITCLFTIFLCTWVVIHPRITKRPLLRVLHKVALFFQDYYCTRVHSS